MKEQNKTPEKELSKTDIPNLSDAEFKTLVIRVLRELLEQGKNNNNNKIKEEMKGTLTEIKNNPQEARIQTNDLDHKEDINIQSEKREETRIQKK